MKTKYYFTALLAIVIAIVSCKKDKEPAPEEEKAPNPIHIKLDAHDNMTFTGGDFFKTTAKSEITLTLNNVGQLPKESMGHNVVVLMPGTNHAEFGGEAFKAKAEDYIPATFASSIVAHTKLLGPGESDQIKFKVEKAGKYTYVCSFPGHWGTMHGVILVE